MTFIISWLSRATQHKQKQVEMDWAEDLKLTIKKNVKKGRRADLPTSSSSPQQSFDKEESLDIDLDLMRDSIELNVKGPPNKRSGGWAEIEVKSGRNRSNRNLIEQERFDTPPSSATAQTNFDDDIPVIPDLDDIQDEILMNDIVEPPSVSVNRTAAFKELNSDLLKQSAFSSLEDIDLSILTQHLLPAEMLEEPDEVWEWEKLFTEVTAEIHAEKGQSKPENNDETPIQFVN